MTTNSFIGHGVAFEKSNESSPLVWTPVAEVQSVSGPSIARDTPDATHATSTERWRDFIAGLKDGGEVTVGMNFLPADTTQKDASGGLLNDFSDNDSHSYRVSWPDSPAVVWSFTAFITAFEPDLSIDDVVTASVTFKITGKPTLA